MGNKSRQDQNPKRSPISPQGNRKSALIQREGGSRTSDRPFQVPDAQALGHLHDLPGRLRQGTQLLHPPGTRGWRARQTQPQRTDGYPLEQGA